MARGILGDDGPSLFMFIAVILIWGKIAGFFNKTTKKVSEVLEIGKNSAGPLQDQTTKEIDYMQSVVDTWAVPWSSLPARSPSKELYYENIANTIFKELDSTFNIDEDKLLAMCRKLSAGELKAVAKKFGVRDFNDDITHLTFFTGNIFAAFEHFLSDTTLGGNDLSEMRTIWAKTGWWN